jgi:hypothetical protein
MTEDRSWGGFLIKSLVFLALFFAVTFAYMRWLAPLPECPSASVSTVPPAAGSMDMTELNRQLDVARQHSQQYDEMMVRSAELLKKQEEHVARYEAVLERWERQTGIRK